MRVPVDVLRDRVLFETAYTCDARACEACGMYVEDLDLRLDAALPVIGEALPALFPSLPGP